jgi:hypothetical protein
MQRACPGGASVKSVKNAPFFEAVTKAVTPQWDDVPQIVVKESLDC